MQRIVLGNPYNYNHVLNKGRKLWYLGLPTAVSGYTNIAKRQWHPGVLNGGVKINSTVNGFRASKMSGTNEISTLCGSTSTEDDSNLPVQQTITIAAWFRVNTVRDYNIMHKGDGATNANSSFFISRYSPIGNTNLGFWVNNGTSWLTVYAGSAYTDGRLHRVVCTVQQGLGQPQLLYVDGRQVGSGTFTGNIPSSFNYNWQWGRHPSVGSCPDEMADMSISSRVWSSDEVLMDYELGLKGYRAKNSPLNWATNRAFFIPEPDPLQGGGALVGGSTTNQLIYIPQISGGALAAGLAINTENYRSITANGTALCAGSASVEKVTNIAPTGGAILNSSAIVDKTFFATITGGAVCSGSLIFAITQPITGGAICAGNGFILFDPLSIVGTGGAVVGSSAVVSLNQAISGGAVANSSAIVSIESLVTGGALLAGNSAISLESPVEGGVFVSGQSLHNSVYNSELTGSALLSGLSLIQTQKVYYYTSDGFVEVSSDTNYFTNDIIYNASGGVELSEDGADNINYRFNKDLEFLWDVDYVIEKDIEFNWSTGELPIYWYRIVGIVIDEGECEPLQGTPCCQRIILNIHARTLSELCEKLSRRKYKYPIESVQRFSRPAETSVINEQELLGVNYDCNFLTPVDICNIPQCAEFCVRSDNKIKMGFSMSVQMNAFLSYTATGNVFTGSSADASYVKNLPDFPYEASGSITVDGEVGVWPNPVFSRGGVTLSGSGYLESSKWSYVGGQWPNITVLSFGQEAESIASEDQDITWQLVERSLNDNGLYTQSDISFGKTSQYLVVRNFNLGLPEDSTILGIKVRVDRLSTQISVRDEEVYLVNGEDIISDNLADWDNDWPLIETTKIYGSDGLGEMWRDSNGDDYLGEFDPEQLNNNLFGVAIRVRAMTSLPITIAKIDYVNIEVFYEDAEGSILKTGGSASVVSPVHHYSASGKVKLVGDTDFVLGKKYVSTGSLELASEINFGIEEFVLGGAEASGESLVSPYFDVASGGIVALGEAVTKPYFETGMGGVELSGHALVRQSKKYSGSGSVVIEGEAFAPEGQFEYEATGSIVLGSNNSIVSSAFTYISDGNVAFILGGSDYICSDKGVLSISSGMSMSILDMMTSFNEDSEIVEAENLDSTVNKCGCLTIPLVVNLTHNIAHDNVFSQFLSRNNYTMSSVLRLRYNSVNDSWQSNLHYRGLSTNNNERESWDMIFELQCSDVMGSISIGRSIWKLAVQVFRKNLTTLETRETRVILGILPDLLCDSTNNQLDFVVSYDTFSDVAVVDPDAVIYQNTIFDNIGLFRNQSWFNDPVLTLKLSEQSDISINRIDITDAILV